MFEGRPYIIMTGGASGADTIAHEVAKKLGLETIVVEAEWNKYGRAAGPLRNRKMLDLKPEGVIAFHRDIQKSKGTIDCMREAMRRGIRVELIPHQAWGLEEFF